MNIDALLSISIIVEKSTSYPIYSKIKLYWEMEEYRN